MELLITSFIAGILTVLSPCVLPLLPIIIGGSLTDNDKKRPYITTLSLAIAVIVFTLLLKTTTLLINISPSVLQYISGSIVLFLGLINIFPSTWDKISIKLNLQTKSDKLLVESSRKRGPFGAIMTGVALGPVFASCSPTYAIIIATVLPASFGVGLLNLIAYAAGLAVFMLLIAVFGQNLIQKVKFAANPNGIFRKVLGVIFVIVGIIVLTGYDKKVQVYLSKYAFLDATRFEQKLLDKDKSGDSGELLSVKGPYEAPELAGIENWINSNELKIKELKGKVVIIDFWTYSCINCIRTLPSLKSWDEMYRDEGLVIIGVHSPEFQFEKNKENVAKAVKEYDLKYPIAMDNNFDTWRAYKNQFWPAKYFIDRNGNVRHEHFGEGKYKESEEVIRKLLSEDGTVLDKISDIKESKGIYNINQTPETYLGYARSSAQANKDQDAHDIMKNYKLVNNENLKINNWSLGGNWIVDEEKIICRDENCIFNLKYSAKEVYGVIGSENKTISFIINSKDKLEVEEYKLYTLIQNERFTMDQYLEIKVPKGGILNALTFGS